MAVSLCQEAQYPKSHLLAPCGLVAGESLSVPGWSQQQLAGSTESWGLSRMWKAELTLTCELCVGFPKVEVVWEPVPTRV